MKYTEVTLHIRPLEPYRDLLIYTLGEEGPYDSFVETADGLKAYVPTQQYEEIFLRQSIQEMDCDVTYEVKDMPDQNWNALWESQYSPVLVDDFCWVRAPFHPHRSDVAYEIEIEPKMSFGTAQHATTYQMLSLLHQEDVSHRRVLDMGCGTAVLAILAALQGAEHVEAIDVDEWAYANAIENCKRNGVSVIVHCTLGNAESLSAYEPFDIILANINRNILLRDMPYYVQSLNPGGAILLSGFYEHDVEVIREQAASLGLQQDRLSVRQEWAAVRFIKSQSK